MLTEIDIYGFKCFDSVKLKLNNLTLLTGINSAGKSSVIQAILLLIQQKERTRNVLNGKYVRLGLMKEVRNSITNAKEIGVRVLDRDVNDISEYRLSLKVEGESQEELKEFPEDKDFIYLSAERIGAEDVYKQNLTGEYRIGIQGEYAFDYLSQERMNELREIDFLYPEAGRNLGNQVDYWLDRIMGYNVIAEQITGTEVVKVSYRRNLNGSGEMKPHHVGTGVSYVASVIISALSCTKRSVFIVENPEIHLHPGAQAKLLEFFCFLASRGLQIIVETHSDHIFNGMRKSIKSKKISRENVSVYFFKLDENFLSKPVYIFVDENGVIRNHEKGLFDQFDEDLDDLLGL